MGEGERPGWPGGSARGEERGDTAPNSSTVLPSPQQPGDAMASRHNDNDGHRQQKVGSSDALAKPQQLGPQQEQLQQRQEPPPPPPPRGNALAQTVAGAVAGSVSRAAVTPLDVAKIRLQLQVEHRQHAAYRGTWHCLSSMARAEGLPSLWRGHVASQLLSISYCAIQVRAGGGGGGGGGGGLESGWAREERGRNSLQSLRGG